MNNGIRINLPEIYRAGFLQKKSGHPTQPGNRSTAPRQPQWKRKGQTIIHQIVRIVKRIKWVRIATVCLVMLSVFLLISCIHNAAKGNDNMPEYIFRNGDGSPIDVQSMASAWAAEAGFTLRYELTDAERWEVASVVTAEAGGEPFAGMVAVAQCILQSCEDDGIRPCEAVTKYKYTQSRPEPTTEALEAVQAVFDFGQVTTHEPIKYFYAPARVYSEWHESQVYVMTINGHKFFKEAE